MKLIKTLTASSLLAITTLAAAQVTWLPSNNGDLRAQALEQNTRDLPASLHQEQAPVSLAWSADQATQGRFLAYRAAAGDTANSGPNATSQGYWLDVSGAELAQGIDLPLSAPGAVIRLSALEYGTALRLDPSALRMTMNGRSLNANYGPQAVATGARMRSQGMPVPSDSLAFQLGRDSAAGTLNLQHPGLPSEQNLVIHVHEPNSEWIAELTLPRANLLSGQALELDLRIGNQRQSLQTTSVQAVLVSPDASETWSLDQQPGRLSLDAAPMASRAVPGSGLYETRVYAEAEVNGITVRRDLSLALNIAPAIARFTGQVDLSRSAGVTLDLGVETAAAGRYQVNAQLMGTNKEGELQAVAVVQSAAVLDAGFGTIQLAIDQNLIDRSGLRAPFEVHELMLLDQGRMSLQEHRVQALRITR